MSMFINMLFYVIIYIGDYMEKVRVTDVDYMGRGVARIDNIVTFIPGVLKDEIVEISQKKSKKNYNEAKLVKVLESNPSRIIPLCLLYEDCGGCDLMHMNYEEQLDFKENKVKNTIKKFANLDIKINKIIKSEEVFNYRNKVTFHVNNVLGFYEKDSNNFIKIDKCLLLDKNINKLMKQLNYLDLTSISEITIRICKNNNESMLILATTKDIDVSRIKGFSSIYLYNGRYILKQGTKTIIERMNDFNFYISPSSFFQINTFQAINLYDKVKEYAALTGKETLLDLYCGTGTIGLYLSRNCQKVYGIELNKDAINDANLNKQKNNIKNVDFYCENANKFMEKVKEKLDVIVVDPPRAGLDSKTINSILKVKPTKVIYVSCDVATLARDLKILNEQYEVLELTPFDMFPNTCHVECVCVMKLNN